LQKQWVKLNFIAAVIRDRMQRAH